MFQFVDADRTAVGPYLIHHIQRQDHGNSQLHELHGQVQIALNIRGVDNIDDPGRPGFHQEIPGYNFLTGIGRQRINPRQIGNRSFRIMANGPVLSIDGDTGKIPDMLLGTGQLIKQGRLAAILVPR